MFGFKGGPESPREIEGFFNELVGPEASAEFWRAYRDAYVTEDDIRFLRDTGANSIRIPLHYKFFTPGNEEGFALLDRVVGWAARYHLYVILDMHCAPGARQAPISTTVGATHGFMIRLKRRVSLSASGSGSQSITAITRRCSATTFSMSRSPTSQS